MKVFVFDAAKNHLNVNKHNISLNRAEQFEWDSAFYQRDQRKEYGEHRIIAIGFIERRLYVLIFVVRDGAFRLISLRKANARERKKYEKEI